MSGFGIGIAVGLGAVIGAVLGGAPDARGMSLITGFVGWSLIAGAVYESVKYMGSYFWGELRR